MMDALILPPLTREGRAILRKLGRCVMCGRKADGLRCADCERERVYRQRRVRDRRRYQRLKALRFRALLGQAL